MGWSSEGQRWRAYKMYRRGERFVWAAALLKSRCPPSDEEADYVTLHLLCQGIELILKALLLLANFDKYYSDLSKRKLGHDLEEIYLAACNEYPPRRQLDGETRSQLAELNKYYSNHILRYGRGVEILVAPQTIGRDRIVRKVGALIKLVNRRLDRAPL